MKIALVIASLILMSCSSTPKRKPVENAQFETVRTLMKEACGDKCQLKQCWQEKDLLACRIHFTHDDAITIQKTLEKMIETGKKQNLHLGLCAADLPRGNGNGGFVFGGVGSGIGMGMGGSGVGLGMGTMTGNRSDAYGVAIDLPADVTHSELRKVCRSKPEVK